MIETVVPPPEESIPVEKTAEQSIAAVLKVQSSESELSDLEEAPKKKKKFVWGVCK